MVLGRWCADTWLDIHSHLGMDVAVVVHAPYVGAAEGVEAVRHDPG